jgi:hypothetical protein
VAEEPRVIQPIVIIPGPIDPTPTADDVEAERFIEDLRVASDLTFTEWVARNRPLPPLELVPDPSPLLADVPD